MAAVWHWVSVGVVVWLHGVWGEDDRLRPALDVAIAVAMASYAFVDVTVNNSWFGPTSVNTVAVVAMTLSLAARRVAPTAVVALVISTVVVLGVAYGSSQAWSSVFPTVVAVYSGAAYARRVWPVVAIAMVGVPIRELNDPLVHSVNDALFASTLVILTLLAGIEGRQQWRRRRILDGRSATLAREEAEMAAAATAERGQIARELHDIISHGLSLMVLQAGAAGLVLEGNDRVRDVLQSIRSTGQEAIDQMGALLGVVRGDAESSRSPQPRLADLPALLAHTREAGLDATLAVEGDATRLTPALELSIYRIVQEGLTNSLKHAGGAHVDVIVSVGAQSVDIGIHDGGSATPGRVGSRRGLAGVAERVAVFGGEMSAGPAIDGGWTLRATLPVN